MTDGTHLVLEADARGGGTEVGVSGHRLVHVLGVRLDHASTGHDERKLDQQGQDDDGETADA